MWIQESVFFPLHVVVMNLDAGSVFFPLHAVVMNVDTKICFLSSSCSGHECGYMNLFSFLSSFSHHECGYRNLFSFLFM